MDNPFEFHEEDGIIACVGDNGGTTDDDIRNPKYSIIAPVPPLFGKAE